MRLSVIHLDSLKIINLGLISYAEGLRQQNVFTELVKRSKNASRSSNFLLCLEHSPVYTVGIRSKSYTEEEEKRLRALGADFCRTSRGGLITFHGPGQLVVYPIVDLRRFSPRKPGVRMFVDSLEQIVIDCAGRDFGVEGVCRSTGNTGVWVGDSRKLCAIGISVQQGITGHGLAINCNTDLTWFDHVVPCGIAGVEATSLTRESARDISTSEVAPVLAKRFADVFECDVTSWEDYSDRSLLIQRNGTTLSS